MSDKENKAVFLGDSARPKGFEPAQESFMPKMPAPTSGIGGIGSSTQPKAPAQPTQQMKPPPSRDD